MDVEEDPTRWWSPLIVNPKDKWDVYVGGFWQDAVKRGVVNFPWANPYWKTFPGALNDHSPEEAARLYEKRIRDRPDLWHRLDELRGKRISCWCRPNDPACHGVILCKLVAERESQKRIACHRVLQRRSVAPSPPSLQNQTNLLGIARSANDGSTQVSNCISVANGDEADGGDGIACIAIEAVISFSEDVQTLLRWRSEGDEIVRDLITGPKGILLARRALGNEYRWLMPGQAAHDVMDSDQRAIAAYSGPTPGRILSEDESLKDRKLLGSNGAFQFKPADWWCDVWYLGESIRLPPLEIAWVRAETDRSWAVRSSAHGAWFHEFTASAPTLRSDALASLLLDSPPHCDPYRALQQYVGELADKYTEIFPLTEARGNLFGADGYRLLCGTDGFEGDQEIVLGGFYSFVVRLVMICSRPDDPSKSVSFAVGRSYPEHFRLGWLVERASLICETQELDPKFRFVLAMGFLEN